MKTAIPDIGERVLFIANYWPADLVRVTVFKLHINSPMTRGCVFNHHVNIREERGFTVRLTIIFTIMGYFYINRNQPEASSKRQTRVLWKTGGQNLFHNWIIAMFWVNVFLTYSAPEEFFILLTWNQKKNAIVNRFIGMCNVLWTSYTMQ